MTRRHTSWGFYKQDPLAVPGRGPNATPYINGGLIDNTASFIARMHTLDLALTPGSSIGLPFSLTAKLKESTLLYSSTPLHYGNTAGLPSAIPQVNKHAKNYFTGRSDNFVPGLSTNPGNARLDPEPIRVSRDGQSVFIGDEYGPYVYQFHRKTGKCLRIYTLPDHFAISNLNSVGAAEISGNTLGRVTNKGMEGLAISLDGSTLIGFMQSPLAQDGGDGGQANLLAVAPVKTLFLDIAAVFKGFGIADTDIPSKLEGLAFGEDGKLNGAKIHTLYLSNDNDFVPALAGANRFYVFGFTDADLDSLGLSFENQKFSGIQRDEERGKGHGRFKGDTELLRGRRGECK